MLLKRNFMVSLQYQMTWTFINQTSIFIAAMFGLAMQYKYYDKRTKIFKILRNVFIVVTIALFPIGMLSSYYDGAETEIQMNILQHNFDSVKTMLDTSIRVSTYTKNRLIKLDSQMTPFLALAKNRYP